MTHPLELKIPPPAVAVLAALAAWALARWLPGPPWSASIRVPTAVVVAAIGAAFSLAGVLAFRAARTTVNPTKPEATSSLVTTGVYRITRNPMYVGLALVLAGWAAYLGSPWAIVGPVLFCAWVGRFQIAPEERVLARRFGAAFDAYAGRVRRWL